MESINKTVFVLETNEMVRENIVNFLKKDRKDLFVFRTHVKTEQDNRSIFRRDAATLLLCGNLLMLGPAQNDYEENLLAIARASKIIRVCSSFEELYLNVD